MSENKSSNAFQMKASNLSIQDYCKNMRYRADLLRRDAEILLKRAEQIDAESWELENAVKPLSDAANG